MGGSLCLRSADGADLTPRARKAQGLLALLGTAPGYRRSRGWLQDKLWSDRGQEQGAASLRQCLTEIRSCLGTHVSALRAEAGWVALDPGAVMVRTDRPAGVLGATEFLEGLDIRDPEFEDWLRDQRSARAEAAPSPAAARAPQARPASAPAALRPVVVVAPAEAARDDIRLFAEMLAESVAMQIAQSGNAQLVDGLSQDAGPCLIGLRLTVRAAELGQVLYLQIRLTELATGTVVWIGLKELDPRLTRHPDEGPLAILASDAIGVAVDELGRMAERASDHDRLALLGYQASRHTVLLDIGEQRLADQMLQQAFEMHPMGVFLARRALLRMTQVIEWMDVPKDETRAEAIEMSRRAYHLDPGNTTVLAAAAKIALNFEGRVQGGLELAQRAVEINPYSPLAWDSLAVARAHTGQAEQAHAAALRARAVASHLPQTFVWDMSCCMTATVAARYDEAIRHGELARDLAPTYKPPLRYLAALYFRAGRNDAAVEQLRRLKALEPDFSLELLADPRLSGGRPAAHAADRAGGLRPDLTRRPAAARCGFAADFIPLSRSFPAAVMAGA